MKYCLICILLGLSTDIVAQVNNQLLELNPYQGSWVIFKNDLKTDTLCLTVADWSTDKEKLLASQWINGENGQTRDSCFYTYDTARKIYAYYETDATGEKIISTSDILINGKTWIYQHHFGTGNLWRTVNIFNDDNTEISFQTQRSDDTGKTWTTTRSGKEYKVK